MEVSRRDFLGVSTAVDGGGALGGLTGLGANLAPTLARAAELRIKDAKTFPASAVAAPGWARCGAPPPGSSGGAGA